MLAHPQLRLKQQRLRSKDGNGKCHENIPVWVDLNQDDILGTTGPAPNPATIQTNWTILNSFAEASHYIASQVLLPNLSRAA
jgi:hypothetical protein